MDNFSQGARQPLSFVLSVMGLMGAFIGLFVGPAFARHEQAPQAERRGTKMRPQTYFRSDAPPYGQQQGEPQAEKQRLSRDTDHDQRKNSS